MSPRAWLLALAAVAGSGCAGGLHSNAPAVQTYVLRATPATAVASPEAVASLRLMRPYASPGLDGEHIVLLESDHRLNYFAGSRWAAPLPDVLEALAVDALRASGAWSAVEDSHSSFAADYYLQITIRRFEADYTGPSTVPVVHVSLSCMLGRRADRELIAVFAAEGSANATENRLAAVVAAFQQAADAALAAAAERAAQSLRTSPPHSPPAGDKPSS